jgi:hypothetical protein
MRNVAGFVVLLGCYCHLLRLRSGQGKKKTPPPSQQAPYHLFSSHNEEMPTATVAYMWKTILTGKVPLPAAPATRAPAAGTDTATAALEDASLCSSPSSS